MDIIDLEFAEEDLIELDFEELEFAEAESRGFSLRGYQNDAIAAIESGWELAPKQLAVLATGGGKTVIFCLIAKAVIERGGRVLILAHTSELLEQTLDKAQRAAGVIGELEKADSMAGLDSQLVVASVQTLTRTNRLTGYPDDHFDLVILDEAHRALAPSILKVLYYFHYGAESLDDGWKPPAPGIPYEHKSRTLGFTATADRGDRRSLGEFFDRCAFDYGLLQAVRDGYLVRPITHNIPLQIDIRGVKVKRGSGGADFDISEVVQKITPFLREAARCIATAAHDRKTVVFLPSIDTARLMSEALREFGIDANFVSGACKDRKEKIEAFDRAGNGSAICNAMLLTEGWDCPDVSCICVMRPTKIRALFVQCVGRGTRPLSGLVDGLATPAERIAAIAGSAKPDLRVIDFLWLSDRLDLVEPVDLVATDPKVRERMMADAGTKTGGDVDLIEAGESAERDLLVSLEAAAKEHSKKKTRIIDPLAFAVCIGDEAIESWTPSDKFDELPPTPEQLKLLADIGIDVSKIKFRGLAKKLMDRVMLRQRAGLATAKQLNFLTALGVKSDEASTLSRSEAHALITLRSQQRKLRPEAARRTPSL